MLRLSKRNNCTSEKTSKAIYDGEERERKGEKYEYRLARQPHPAS